MKLAKVMVLIMQMPLIPVALRSLDRNLILLIGLRDCDFMSLVQVTPKMLSYFCSSSRMDRRGLESVIDSLACTAGGQWRSRLWGSGYHFYLTFSFARVRHRHTYHFTWGQMISRQRARAIFQGSWNVSLNSLAATVATLYGRTFYLGCAIRSLLNNSKASSTARGGH